MNIKKILIVTFFTLVATNGFSHDHDKRSADAFMDSVYNANKEEILRHSLILGEDVFVSISLYYKYDENSRLELEHYCVEKERLKSISNYVRIAPIQRVKFKAMVDSVYQDSINMKLIPYNYNISGNAISRTLGLADFLKLPDDTRKVLMDNALDFARRRRKNPYDNFAVDEMKVLRKYIKSDDLMNILIEKNKDEAIRRAHAAWDTLKNAKLTDELDSAKQVVSTQFYYEKEMAIRDLYVGDDDVRERNLSDLYANRTKLIVMYDAYLAKKRIKKENEKKVIDGFAW